MDVLTESRGPLAPADAVAAVLVLPDNRYLLQQRDDFPDIWYPGHWGCFGGAVDKGETPQQTLDRELREEIDCAPQRAEYLTRFDFDLTRFNRGSIFRIYYTIPISFDDVSKLKLGEGRGMRIWHVSELLSRERVVPYDAFAIWLHACGHRLNGSQPASI